jgi:hypothetical protein
VRISLPQVARRLPLDHPDLAVQEYAEIVRGLRDAPGGAADLEALATEAMETARREGAILLAVVMPPDAAPALLTGRPVDAPAVWDADSALDLRDSLENVGGPDVRETVLVETGLGPAVVVQRIPGKEQALARRPLTLQLQAYIPEPETGRMLLLTLACPAAHGWAIHQAMFGQIVSSAAPDDAGAAPPVATPRRAPVPVAAEESFEEHTYRL